MNEEEITINIDRLRSDLYEECLGAFFGGGYGGAMFDASDVESATPEQLVAMAQRMGVNLLNYRV